MDLKTEVLRKMELQDQHFNQKMEKTHDNMAKFTNIISDSMKKLIESNAEQMSYPLQRPNLEFHHLQITKDSISSINHSSERRKRWNRKTLHRSQCFS